VASPVGANTEAVIDGVTGYYARGIDEWEHSLERLIESSELRARLGAGGRAHVEQRYSMRAYQERYVQLLGQLVAV
jgi:glycosyltransferase involved in cell wall biosynthesis